MTVGANNQTTNIVDGTSPPSLPSVEDPSALVVCGVIIVGAGLFGGFAAYLTEANDPAAPANSTRWPLLRFLMLGFVASACVPLFLSLIRSQIMTAILARNSANRLESYLVFGGFCLLAAYSARSFITSISQRVLQQIQEVRREQKQTAEKVDDLSQVVAAEVEGADDLSGMAAPAEIQADTNAEPAQGHRPSLSFQERAALEALARKTYRTRTGVAEDSGIAINRISEVLEDLASKKLALQTKSPRTGGLRWAISKRGEQALKG